MKKCPLAEANILGLISWFGASFAERRRILQTKLSAIEI